MNLIKLKSALLLIISVIPQPLFADGIDSDKLDKLARDYLMENFNESLKSNELEITNLHCSPSSRKGYYKVAGDFRNFKYDGETLDGRLETEILLTENFLGYKVKENKQDSIILFVEDVLTDEMRESMLKDYINSHYRYPIDISMKKARSSVSRSRVKNSASFVIDNSKIYYIEVIFEQGEKSIAKIPGSKFVINKQPWKFSRTEREVSLDFPKEERIKRDLKIKLYNYVLDQAKTNNTKCAGFCGGAGFYRVYNESGSGMGSIITQPKQMLKNARDGKIELNFDANYLLDLHGGPGSFIEYKLNGIEVIYNYNYDKNLWELISLNTESIKPIVMTKD